MVKIVFVHPDLGIGGAERLVIDAALALKKKSHEVSFVTAHHDPTHCFPETINGELSVTCVGDWLPRSTFGHFYAFWAYVRMIYIAIYLVLFSGISYDIAFVDQISACIPFLRIRSKSKVLFYCHYPDQLLTDRKSVLKQLYRFFLDTLEEFTTKMSDLTLVNSKFTSAVFKETFSTIKQSPIVLYPSLDFSKFDKVSIQETPHCDKKYVFLTLNRFERKKNVNLAIEAFKILDDMLKPSESEKIHLIVAGGYDNRVVENFSYHDELVALANSLELNDKITFMKSPTDEIKISLLKNATCLLYTPDKEHFGIIPIESMYMGTPVIAVNSGGPLETVLDNETGFLRPQDGKKFAEVMSLFVHEKISQKVLGIKGHNHVIKNFSFDSFAENLDNIVGDLFNKKDE